MNVFLLEMISSIGLFFFVCLELIIDEEIRRMKTSRNFIFTDTVIYYLKI